MVTGKSRETAKGKMEMVPGFEEATGEEILRLILNVEANEKEGKTHLALTAPGPIADIDMDVGSEGVIKKFVNQKKIYVAKFNYHDVTSQDEWEKMWNRVKATFLDALASKNIRTVMGDTFTEMWELIRLAKFGKLAQVKPYHYAPVNAEFRDLIRKAYDTDKNFILLHKLKKEYIDENWTGRWERAGFGDVGYAVQANIISWRVTALDETYGKGREDGYKGFGITIRDCRQQAELAGTELLEPLNNFAVLASQIFPSTDTSDWE